MFIMETCISDRRFDRIIPTLGFPNHFRVPSVGYAGGIWVLWNGSLVTVDILAAVHQLGTLVLQQL